MIVRLADRELKTRFGVFQEYLYYDGQSESAALVMGDVKGQAAVLCRVHSACMAAHVFNSIECDCREQMEIAQSLIQAAGRGVIIWLDQEGRGNGHYALIQAARYAEEHSVPQTEAYRTLGFSEDARSYASAAAILSDLGVESIVLITNNPEKVNLLTRDGVNVAGTKPAVMDVRENETLRKYYADKKSRGHQV
jgi:GTP cyclohydrolase II